MDMQNSSTFYTRINKLAKGKVIIAIPFAVVTKITK